jgi:4-diphosphocytidyl-2-C-methyl-D-erythritol kinase
MSAPRCVTIRSFAKVNLDLRVLHRRPDGYHEIRSLFHTISLADRIALEFSPARRTELSVVCAGLDLAQEQNLAYRAAAAFLEHTKCRGKLTVSIDKRIPMGGGLGGGSSNAASVLLALPALTGKALSLKEMLGLAASLGSDVPFFLLGGAAVALGRGEELYPAPDFPAIPGLLVAPGISVSTPEAYRSLQRGEESAASAKIVTEFSSQIANLCQSSGADAPGLRGWGLGTGRLGVNHFEEPVFQVHPSLRTVKRSLLQLGAGHAMMSGSGSSIFGLFDSVAAAREAKAQMPGDVRLFRLLPRRQYQRAWHLSLRPYSNHLWPPHPKTA